MTRWTRREVSFMQRALELAQRGQGRVEPNPMVGCVVVRGDRVVGEGYHQRFGGAHAEVNALRAAGRRAKGATLYVTLEPCGHHGKTPPCTDAVIAAGVGRVVAATRDPNPLVSGRGLAALRRARVRVALGLMRDEAEALNAPFITVHTLGRPYIILKWAQSIDGKIATRTGASKWITSVESRRAAHALRARVDAIVVGVDTVIADDPLLTARWARPVRVARRVVLDGRLRTPPTCRLVRTARTTPTLIVTGRAGRSAGARRKRLERAGCEVVELPATAGGGVGLHGLLRLLKDRGTTNVLVEGGGKVLGAFLDAGLADEARVFVAPRLIGGERAPGPLRGRGIASIGDDRTQVEAIQVLGTDCCYNLRFRR